MDKFQHKTFGAFARHNDFDEYCWEGEIELPAFSAFKYSGNGKARRSKKVEVSIYSEEPPSKSAMKMLSKIKTSQKRLVKSICQTFFDDLHQQGYQEWPKEGVGFGMWWSRDPVAVALSCRDVLQKRLKQDRIWIPDDLLVVLYEPSIEIHLDMPGANDLPCTLISLGAEFEEEHGVSVLTDGKQVLNLGYAGEA
ncbi:MAG: hypothetical protein NXI04_03385 [Planctomycetaceae bacterium]|nr:hypothetical protein [Planctomycetaceae bacterium]